MLKVNLFKKQLEAIGFVVTELNVKSFLDERAFAAECGDILINFNSRTAVIFKPNGTHKYYYEKSNAQLLSIVKAVLRANS